MGRRRAITRMPVTTAGRHGEDDSRRDRSSPGDRPAIAAAPAALPADATMERLTATGEPAFGFLLGDGILTSPRRRLRPDRRSCSPRRAVEITLVNQLPESTAIHWHGMELETYYDGVHDWSGIGGLAPMIEPDGAFTVRFTPPRSGTFMYHTHMHDDRQLPLGPLRPDDRGGR